MELTAVVQLSPPKITLQWNRNDTSFTLTAQKVYRRLKNASSWTQIATPANAATTYQDSNVTVGTSYEYHVGRTFSDGPGFADGYVASGIRVPLIANRGRVIVVVDDTMAAPLSAELTRLATDLNGDGWTVVRQDVSRTATAASIRTTIQSIYNASPSTTVAVLLLGHVPVPYSGDIAIDGHPDHFGAWPTDLYYGEMNSMWSDTMINDSGASDPRNRNIWYDGKFDSTTIPSDIELEVGRVDLANMPSFGATEVELLRRYLDHDHAYRYKLGGFANVGRRGLVDDNFGFFGGEAFAVTAWRSFTACVGAGNVQELDWFGTLQNQSYLWAYGCGGGNYTGAQGVGTSLDFASKDSLAVFTVLFGSYFGDWDNLDAFLRAPLAGTTSSLGLVSCWAGRPHWYFHPMALGETVGYAARLTQNNLGTVQKGYDPNVGNRYNHVALLGDPTLRLYPVIPPSSLVASVSTNAVTLNWTASTDTAIEGYHIARANSPAGPFVQLQSALVTNLNFVDGTATPGTSYTYMVRAVKLETSPTGTYLNSSQGIFSPPILAGTASGPEIDLSGNGNPITAGDLAPSTATGTDFGSVTMPDSTTHTFTIANVGTAALGISSAAITGSPDFTLLQSPPAMLGAGTSATFQIKFQPSAMGSRSATFTLVSNDADEGSYQFALGGTGLPAPAAIALYPPAINRSIHADTSATETLNISDPAAGVLTYTIFNSLERYAARDSDSFGGPTYAWMDISTTGQEITSFHIAMPGTPQDGTSDDEISGSLSMNFNFPFYGATFNSLQVCTNGFLSFTDTFKSASNTQLPSSSAATNIIAPLWSDLFVNVNSHVYWQALEDKFIVQFEDVALYGDRSAHLTFQVILEAEGSILYQYKTLTQLGSIYTVGIQNGARDQGLLVAFNAPYLHENMAIRIRPPGLETWLSSATTSGTVAAGGTQQIATTLNAAGLAPGDYYATLTVFSNAAGDATEIIPVRLTVGDTPVENWRKTYFGSTANSGGAADTADADGDGVNNLLEYAFGSDPLVPDGMSLMTTSVDTSGYLQIQFNRDASRTDLRYIVEASSDLTGVWTPIASGIHGAPVITIGAKSSAESGAGDVKTITVEDTAPANTFPQRFLRVRAVRD